jgi:anti-sigma regulatory factor (Ser/Thr protein kinase)
VREKKVQRRDGLAQIPDEMTQPATADKIPALVEFISAHVSEGVFSDARIDEIGQAVEEALQNIVNFACCDRSAEISVRCFYDNTETFRLDIVDTGKPFNQLVAGVFPETQDFVDPEKTLSLKKLKKAIKIIEYRRDGELNKNILACWIPK